MVIDVSNDHVASIFRVKKSKNDDLTIPDGSGTTSLRNFGQYSPFTRHYIPGDLNLLQQPCYELIHLKASVILWTAFVSCQ